MRSVTFCTSNSTEHASSVDCKITHDSSGVKGRARDLRVNEAIYPLHEYFCNGLLSLPFPSTKVAAAPAILIASINAFSQRFPIKRGDGKKPRNSALDGGANGGKDCSLAHSRQWQAGAPHKRSSLFFWRTRDLAFKTC